MARVVSRYHAASPPISTEEDERPVRVVLSTRSGEVRIVDDALWRRVEAGRAEELPSDLAAELEAVELLVDAEEDELATVLERSDRATAESTLLYRVVQPTAACQLGCPYCGQEHGPDQLSEADQDAFVSRVGRTLDAGEHRRLYVGWFGAEPLLGMGVIRAMTPRLRSVAAAAGCTYGAKVVTNGLLLDPDLATELNREHAVDFIEVTLDGPPWLHDARRHHKNGRASFDRIFRNLVAVADDARVDAMLTVRCNVDRSNASGVIPLIDLLASVGLAGRVQFYTAGVHSWGNDAHLASFDRAEFAELQNEWIAHLILKGFNPGLIPRPKPVTCLATMRDGELVDSVRHALQLHRGVLRTRLRRPESPSARARAHRHRRPGPSRALREVRPTGFAAGNSTAASVGCSRCVEVPARSRGSRARRRVHRRSSTSRNDSPSPLPWGVWTHRTQRPSRSTMRSPRSGPVRSRGLLSPNPRSTTCGSPSPSSLLRVRPVPRPADTCRSGQPVDLASAVPCELHAHLDALILHRVTPGDLDAVRTTSDVHATALRLARCGKTGQADALLMVGGDLLAATTFVPEVRLALASMRGGVLAYVRHKQGRHTSAETILIDTMETDAELIARSGMRSLLAHVVQLGHNMVRIGRSLGPEHVISRSDAVLRYLDGGVWPWPPRTPLPPVTCLSTACLGALRSQIRAELATGA